MIQYSMEASSRSGSAVSFRHMSAVCARAWTAIPASTMVLCRPERSSAESPSASATAASAPAKEAAVTAPAPDKNRIPAAAPALAPEETPITSGDASGLRKTVW